MCACIPQILFLREERGNVARFLVCGSVLARIESLDDYFARGLFPPAALAPLREPQRLFFFRGFCLRVLFRGAVSELARERGE